MQRLALRAGLGIVVLAMIALLLVLFTRSPALGPEPLKNPAPAVER